MEYSLHSCDELFTTGEIRKLLLSLNTTKPPGPDRVHPKLQFELANIVDRPLCMIFNSSFVTRVVPDG